MANGKTDWDRMTELIALTIITGHIQECAPQSLLIVGGPGTGKTALIERFAKSDDPSFNPTARLMGNLSQWGLRSFLQLEAPRGVSHVLAPEMQTLFMRRPDTWAAVEGLLLQAMAEGVGDYYNGPIPESYGKVRIGLVAAMTREAYLSVRASFRKSGLTSRFLVVRWTRTKTQMEQSLRAAARGQLKALSKVDLRLPPVRVSVRCPEAVQHKVLDYATMKFSDEMNRAFARFVALTRAAAFRRGSQTATLADWRSVLDCERLWLGEV